MVKLVFLLVAVFALGGLFGTSLSTLLGGLVQGGSMISSALTIFIDFFGRILISMLGQAYIQNIIYMGLFVMVMFALVKLLRDGGVGDIMGTFDEEEIIEDGRLVSTVKTRRRKKFFGRGYVTSVNRENAARISSSETYSVVDGKRIKLGSQSVYRPDRYTKVITNYPEFVKEKKGKK